MGCTKKEEEEEIWLHHCCCFQEFSSAQRKIQEKFESQDKHHLVPPTKLGEYSSWMANFNPNRESRELEIPGTPLLFAVCRYNLVLVLLPSSCAFRSLQLACSSGHILLSSACLCGSPAASSSVPAAVAMSGVREHCCGSQCILWFDCCVCSWLFG